MKRSGLKNRQKWAQYATRFVSGPHLGFVFLNTVHFSRPIDTEKNQKDMAWLVHEMMHISQYQKYGVVYIIKALRAQRNGGYKINSEWLTRPLKDCNFEQQAEIAKQYYLTIKTTNADGLRKFSSLSNDILDQKFC